MAQRNQCSPAVTAIDYHNVATKTREVNCRSEACRAGTLFFFTTALRDFVTRDLFSDILKSEEESIEFIETQLELIAKIGLENYIQLQCEPADK